MVASTVVRFFRSRIGKSFRANDLLRYCLVLHPEIAPDSPTRIMRDLRGAGMIDYTILSRQESRYLVLYVEPGRLFA